jgi:hypothetical protein
MSSNSEGTHPEIRINHNVTAKVKQLPERFFKRFYPLVNNVSARYRQNSIKGLIFS